MLKLNNSFGTSISIPVYVQPLQQQTGCSRMNHHGIRKVRPRASWINTLPRVTHYFWKEAIFWNHKYFFQNPLFELCFRAWPFLKRSNTLFKAYKLFGKLPFSKLYLDSTCKINVQREKRRYKCLNREGKNTKYMKRTKRKKIE